MCTHTFFKLAQLYWPESLWETFSADCNLFREHQPSVTVSLSKCMQPHINTVHQNFPRNDLLRKTVEEETRALGLYLQMEEHSMSTFTLFRQTWEWWISHLNLSKRQVQTYPKMSKYSLYKMSNCSFNWEYSEMANVDEGFPHWGRSTGMKQSAGWARCVGEGREGKLHVPSC